jgi:ABC-type transport system involved in multi-copper enzyme maturation permease subunit
MYFFENPVLQRELLVNLRTRRSFLLLLVYQILLAVCVLIAWPTSERLQSNASAAQKLVDLFFLGQYVLASLMAPSFAAAAITGEKERKTYEMLLASPIRPASIVLGKLLASLAHLAILIFSSLPIVLLCLPLGGVSLYEVLAAYLALMMSVMTFGMISMTCSSYFRRTAASLVVSYLLILPLVIIGVWLWQELASEGPMRLFLTTTILPACALALCFVLFLNITRRMLYPPDVGSEGKEVVEVDEDESQLIGLVIRRDQWPDRLFAPPKRKDLMPDGTNPVLEKELHSEIFSQGTLMLRLVIQISMLLAMVLMSVFLFIMPIWIAWYTAYVITFNVLVGPVFSAGAVTGERERQTLDLLLTTVISPGQILLGKWISGLRVSSVLTMFLLWPIVLAVILVGFYHRNLAAVLAHIALVLSTCLTTSLLALTCSVFFRKTSLSLTCSYLILGTWFCLPLAARFIGETFAEGAPLALSMKQLSIISPYAAGFAIPLRYDSGDTMFGTTAVTVNQETSWAFYGMAIAFQTSVQAVLAWIVIRLFGLRWRVAY